MSSGQNRALSFLQNAAAVVHIQRVPVLVSLFAALCLIFPEQTREIYRALAQDVLFNKSEWSGWTKLQGPLSELGFASLGLLLMGLAIWWVARRLANRLGEDVAPAARRALNVTPRVLTLGLFLSAATGVLLARTPQPTDEVRNASLLAMQSVFRRSTPVLEELLDELFEYNHYLLLAAISCALAGVALFFLLPSAKQIRREDQGPGPRSLYGYWGRLAVFSCVAAIIVVFVSSPVDVPRHVGPLGIYAVFVICLLVILGQLSYLSDVYHVPTIMIVGCAALLISLLDANDNHTIYRTTAAPAISAEAPPTLESEFTRWYEARPDRAQYGPNRPYPIYVVAAQGGGIYAAIHTASVLGSLQEQCPAFADHLFAISSVSGGSLGAAVFAGLLPHQNRVDVAVQEACRDTAVTYRGSLIDLSERVLYKDMLSPLISALLFPDFLQFMVPYPIASFDRALRFEKAFERVFEDTLREIQPNETSNFLASRYRDHWNPAGSSPALVFNATEVGSGRRRVVSPFTFTGSDAEFLPIWGATNSPRNIANLPVSAAAILSARFPWITPAGSFYEEVVGTNGAPERDRSGSPVVKKIRLVDGSYFENSGVATALDLIRNIEAVARSHGWNDAIQLHLIVLTRGGYPQQTFFGLGEAVSPVEALLNTRTSRAYITIEDAKRELGDPAGSGQSSRMRKISLRDMDYSPPLGWRLSSVTMLLILAQNGFPGECAAKPEGSPEPRKYDADCLLEEVAQELKANK